MLSEEAIEEFKGIYEREYKVRLSNEEAMEFGTRLVNLVKAVYKPNLGSILIDTEAIKRDN